jgi:hypothetical protein
MLATKKINLLALSNGEWEDYLSIIVNKATRNTGEMEPVRTSPLQDFTMEATIHVPITQPIPVTATAPTSNLHTDKHSLYNIPWRIDALIDQYSDQQKVTESIRVNPNTARLISKLTTTWHGETYYVFQGTVLIKLISDASIHINSILIDYK